MQTAGIIVFLLNQSIAMIYVWFIFFSVGAGATWTLVNLIMARYFGRKAFGSIIGFQTIVMMPGGIAAPIYAGWVYDTTSSYVTVFTFFAALLTFATMSMFFARPPKPPAQVPDIGKIV